MLKSPGHQYATSSFVVMKNTQLTKVAAWDSTCFSMTSLSGFGIFQGRSFTDPGIIEGRSFILKFGNTYLQAQKEATLVQEAALETAQAAEQRLRQQLSSSSSSGRSVREAQAESDSLRQQLEESARKYNTVKQARERAMTEVVHVKTSYNRKEQVTRPST